MRFIIIIWLAVSGLASPARSQEFAPGDRDRPLTIDEAIEEALAGNAELRIATSRDRMARLEAGRAGAFLWPQIGVGFGVVRSTDPVFAFGTKLRQSRFTEADFGLDELNEPSAINDWATTVDARWGLLDPVEWMTWSAARHGARAASWDAVRAREATVLRVRELYIQAVQARAQREAAASAEAAAKATLDRFQRRHEQGLLTEADRLQAEADWLAAQADGIDATRGEDEARRALGVFLGWSPQVVPLPVDTLTLPALQIEDVFDPAHRADLRGLAERLEASRSRNRGAWMTFAPSVDAFGRYAAHADDPFDSDATDWTVGVGVRWAAFTGFGRLSARRAASEAETIARVQLDLAMREARREADHAVTAVRTSERQVEAALAARRAAEKAAELMRRRFEEGLAAPSDLLQAEGRATSMRSRAIDALAGYHISVARAEFLRSRADSRESS